MSTSSPKSISDAELASLRQNINLIRSQIQAGRLDGNFLKRQIDNVALVLERMAAERQQGGDGGQFEALYNVSRALGSSLDLQVVLDQVMDAIIQLTGAERGFLMLRDDDGGLDVKAARNLDQQTLSSDDFKYSRTVSNQVLDSGEPILTTNAAEDPRFAGQASIVAQSLRSVMATPLRARGNVIGVAYVDSKALAGLFKADDLTALDALSGQAAVAIDNALLFNATDQELAQRVEELRQLRRIDLLLNQTLDVDKAMQYTLDWACRLIQAGSGHLGLSDKGHFNTVHSYGVDASAINLAETYPDCMTVLEQGKMRISQVDDDIILIVPISREQMVFGVVVLRREASQPFTEDEQDLVERVVNRAAIAIENGRLYAAVQAADKAKSEFVGIVAHDLKAPMNGIGGYSELMLMQGELNERQTDYLRKIKDTVHRMEMLVSDLADISRIEGGQFFMEATVTPVIYVLQSLKDATMPEIQRRNHTYVEDIEADLPDMYVDYYRLLQVLTNLVSNAYKYTPDGGKITLRAWRDGDRISFQVTDTGIGLSEEAVAKLGTKFWRSEDRYTRSQPGTGLGFAITSSLIEQMGSEIEIKSTPGEGSSFSFSVAINKD